MTELPDEIYDKVEILSERGNALLEIEHDWQGAAKVWREALDLLPEPKTDWEAALWLYASLGEAYRVGHDLESAKDVLYSALNCPDGHMNPLVLLRLGQTLVDLGETDKGVEHLLRAYMIDGTELFEEDGARYLDILRSRKLVN